MIKKLIYKLLNIRKPEKPSKMKWVWHHINVRAQDDNKFVDIRSKM